MIRVPDRRPPFFALNDLIVHIQRIVHHGMLRFFRLDGVTGNMLDLGLVPMASNIFIGHLYGLCPRAGTLPGQGPRIEAR